jgi:hypothetical protein
MQNIENTSCYTCIIITLVLNLCAVKNIIEENIQKQSDTITELVSLITDVLIKFQF